MNSKNISHILLYTKALNNIILLKQYNKNEQLIDNISKLLLNKKNISYKELYSINQNIDKIFISNTIKESLYVLEKKKSIIKYQELFTKYNIYDLNDDMFLLVDELQYEIKEAYTNRDTFNLLPFYINVFLKKK